jgi:tetratricopeptide (TPR) repeat protein
LIKEEQRNDSTTRSSSELVSITTAPQPSNVTQSISTPEDHQDPSFMYARLLRELLISMDTSSSDIRRDLVVECCKRYANDPLELTYVDELDVEYTAERAIWWYSRPTFMYRMLNHALLTQNIEILYKMRFFVKDLHLQLEKLHSQYVQTLPSNSITVYRGLSLSDDIFKQIEQNLGGLISFNTFSSTSTERKVALSFATQKLNYPGIQSVLFEMKINVAQCRSPFADIQELSEVKGEKEILFSMGTVFRIRETEKLPKGVWKVQLSLDGDEDIQLRRLTEHMRVELQGLHPLFTLGRLMKTLGQYDKAEHFYQMLMTETKSFASNPTEQAKLYSDLGTIYMDKRLYFQALEYFQQSLKYNSDSAECYGNLGLVYQELGKHDQALENLHRAIELDRNANVPSQKVAIQLNNLGTVLYKQSKFEQARQNYEQALKLRLECLPSTHPDIAQSHSNIGAVFYAQKNYIDALRSFTSALEIKSASLPSEHPSLAITFNNVARTLVSQRLYEKALPNAIKAVEISTKALTEHHPQTQEFITSLQCIRQQLSKTKNN